MFNGFAPPHQFAQPARIMLPGTSGSGRTYTSLRIAEGLAPGGKIGLVDTQRGHSRQYSGEFTFEMAEVHAFSPDTLKDAVAHAASARYDVLIIDTVSPFYSGREGILNKVDLAKANGQYGWGAVRGDEDSMADALSCFDGHLILNMNVKTEWVNGVDGSGQPTRFKVGLEPDYKKGAETGYHLVGYLDGAQLTVNKSLVRTLPPGLVVPSPGEEIGGVIAKALGQGEPLKAWRDFWEAANAEGVARGTVAMIGEDVKRKGLGGAVFIGEFGERLTLTDALRDRYRALSAKAPA